MKHALLEHKRLKMHPRDLFSISGYELIGTESYDEYNNYTYFVFQWIDVPISVEWATDYRKKIENGEIQED